MGRITWRLSILLSLLTVSQGGLHSRDDMITASRSSSDTSDPPSRGQVKRPGVRSEVNRGQTADVRLKPSQLEIPAELAKLFRAPSGAVRVGSTGDSRLLLSDVSRLNFSAIQQEIDHQLLEVARDPNQLGVNRRGRMLPAFISQAVNLFDIQQVWREIETSVMSSVSCTACKAGVGLLQHYVSTGRTKSEIVHAAIKLCRNLQFESPRVCEGIIHLFADEILYVFERIALSPEEVCGMAVGDVCAVPVNPWHAWTVPLPAIPKPYGPPPEPDPDAATSRVLHISDTHFDPYYKEGSNAECGEPLCCRETSGIPRHASHAAGYWGDYRRCDTPRRTIENMLQHIAQVHGSSLDYIIWTGDLPPHDVWNQSRHENIDIIRQSHQMLLKYFPKTRIFPSLGNHEAAPVNSFPPPYVTGRYSVSWLYDELDREWSSWLPETTSATIRRGAFYSTLVKPGLRIVSLNMNYCNNKNWWLLLNATDPAEELSWLVYELQAAEFNQEKVHILGHIPPGHTDCLAVWSKNYYRIVDRFSWTIAGQFFGHTHYDEYQLFYDADDGYATTNVAYVAPSVTSYFDLNPGYRIYDVDQGYSKMVVDHETWIMDLDQANRFSYPHWFRLYSARQAYGLSSLAPSQWDRLVHRMSQDDNLFQMYYRNYMKASPVRPACDNECKKRLLCDIVSGRSNARQYTCKRLNQKLEAQDRSGWMSWMTSSVGITAGIIGTALVGIPMFSMFMG